MDKFNNMFLFFVQFFVVNGCSNEDNHYSFDNAYV